MTKPSGAFGNISEIVSDQHKRHAAYALQIPVTMMLMYEFTGYRLCRRLFGFHDPIHRSYADSSDFESEWHEHPSESMAKDMRTSKNAISTPQTFVFWSFHVLELSSVS